ncbi:tripartite tricarboxylate transporter substrate binding protein [Puniceibacterium sp. IMCC21224]|uniref:Bug family tripartite tricarboxylate transporter substrate binding protein n=1 Tax=Puniceibacterium sp. IMCC21224 TaxID=1618204 RepID=UPI00064DD70A|nr:hypothetical protein [Puniceibacterium sp. IMCC21224]KMK64761.1 hypothetical protein IMCC21224_124 [Puniceibacterium sp. IMCC21224]
MSYFRKPLMAGAAIAAIAIPSLGLAQDLSLEGKTVTIIVPFAEGGGADRLSRILLPSLSKNLPGTPNIIVLNQPGGGGVTAANAFQSVDATDGTQLLMASTSTFLPKMLGADIARFDPTEWTAVAGFPRGALLYGIKDQLGVDGGGADPAADYAALKDAPIRFGLSTPIAAEMLDLVALDLLGLDPRVIFGLDSADAEAAFLRAELNMNTDNTLSFISNFQEDANVVALWSYGFVDEAGALQQDPDLPGLPTFEEFFETATGSKPEGQGYELLRNLMNAKVMISKALMLPAGTSDEVRDMYVDAMRQVVTDPDVRAVLDKELGQMPVNFGVETARAIASGTRMEPEVRDWANEFLMENYDTSLDG